MLDIETDMVGRVRRLAVGEPFFPAEGGERRASLRVVNVRFDEDNLSVSFLS